MTTAMNASVRRGISLQSRYWVAWVVPSLHKRPELQGCFDDFGLALEHIAMHPDVLSGGIYDRRQGRWVV